MTRSASRRTVLLGSCVNGKMGRPISDWRNALKMKANGLEVGPILMGMGNRAHVVTPSPIVWG